MWCDITFVCGEVMLRLCGEVMLRLWGGGGWVRLRLCVWGGDVEAVWGG